MRPDEAGSAGDQNPAFSQHGRLSGAAFKASSRVTMISKSRGSLSLPQGQSLVL
jgi:hypothetical protein